MSDLEFTKEIRAASQTPADRAGKRYSTFWPFTIVLVTLIFTAGRDTWALYSRTNVLLTENARGNASLKQSGPEADFLDKLRVDLRQQAISDPLAAQIVAEFFPAPPPPPLPPPMPNVQKPGSPSDIFSSMAQKLPTPTPTPKPGTPAAH